MFRVLLAVCLTAIIVSLASAQPPQNERRILERIDLPTPGYELVLVEGLIPVGGREGRHTHPGALVAVVQSGTVTLEHEDRSPAIYSAGDSLEVEPNKIHEGINTGNTPAVLIAAFVVEKGKPLATQVD